MGLFSKFYGSIKLKLIFTRSKILNYNYVYKENFDLDRDSRKVTEETRVGFVNLAGILLVAH